MAGRPTKYSKEMLEKADEYIDGGYIDEGDRFPMAEGLACYLGVVASTLYKWAEDHEEFSETLKHLKQTQARVVLNNSIDGQFNSTISKLVLHNHGYSDRQVIAGDEDQPLAVTEVTRKVIMPK
jgi:hypothetical protein